MVAICCEHAHVQILPAGGMKLGQRINRKQRTWWQIRVQSINESYLASLEMGLSFDLQSAGDSFSDAVERKEIKWNPPANLSSYVINYYIILMFYKCLRSKCISAGKLKYLTCTVWQVSSNEIQHGSPLCFIQLLHSHSLKTLGSRPPPGVAKASCGVRMASWF